MGVDCQSEFPRKVGTVEPRIDQAWGREVGGSTVGWGRRKQTRDDGKTAREQLLGNGQVF